MEILIFSAMGMNLKSIMLSEIGRQRKTNTAYSHLYVQSIKKKTATDSCMQKAKRLPLRERMLGVGKIGEVTSLHIYDKEVMVM